jgi:hypothetical protein
MLAWRDSLDDPDPDTSGGALGLSSKTTDPTKRPPTSASLPPEVPTIPSSSYTYLERIAKNMTQRLEMLQKQQDQFNRDLIQEMKTAVRSSTSRPSIKPILREPTRARSKDEIAPPVVDIVTDLPFPSKPKRLYAVVKGRSIGIMDSWKAVLSAVSGYPNSKYKSFRNRVAAQDWYLEQLQVLVVIPPDTELSEDEDVDEATIDYNAQGLPQTSDHGM